MDKDEHLKPHPTNPQKASSQAEMDADISTSSNQRMYKAKKYTQHHSG
jgi:hypothetical protein